MYNTFLRYNDFKKNRIKCLNELIAKFQITIHVKEVTSDLKGDDSKYDEKETYVVQHDLRRDERKLR